MVGNLPATPLEFGTVFRNTTWASLDQEGFSLATTGAQTQWPPKILLGLQIFAAGRIYMNLPSWEISAIDVEFWRSNLPEFLEFCKP